jgi:hypothetical protein
MDHEADEWNEDRECHGRDGQRKTLEGVAATPLVKELIETLEGPSMLDRSSPNSSAMNWLTSLVRIDRFRQSRSM